MSRTAKIFLIIGFILVVVIVGYGLYIFFFQPLGGPQTIPGTNNVNGGLSGSGTNVNRDVLPGGAGGRLPGTTNANVNVNAGVTSPATPAERASAIANGGLTQITTITDVYTYNPTLASSGSKINFYDRQSGTFQSIDSDGRVEPVSEKVFHQVQDVTWSPQKTAAIMEYPDGSNIYYDFAREQQVTLPAHWQEFDFSPDGKQIITKSIGTNKESRYLVTSDPSGKQTQIIAQLGANQRDVIVDWSPNDQMIAMVVGDVDIDSQEVFFVGKNDENFKSTIVEGWGFDGQWTPQGDRLLYSVYNDSSANKPQLWIVDALPQSIGRNRRNLNVQTWADKCTFAGNATVYCAVPQSLEAGAGLFPDELDTGPDTIYKIDLNAASKTVIARPEIDSAIENIIVSQDGKYLYYTDKSTGRLNKIRLR